MKQWKQKKLATYSYCIKDGLVFGQCNHAQPVAQVLQQGTIREIGSCLVRGQKNLREMERWEGCVSNLQIMTVLQQCYNCGK